MDQQLRLLRETLAKIAAESFDPRATRLAKEALEQTRPGA
jgi:hypothetical protein